MLDVQKEKRGGGEGGEVKCPKRMEMDGWTSTFNYIKCNRQVCIKKFLILQLFFNVLPIAS
jgi:hypothetical protein